MSGGESSIILAEDAPNDAKYHPLILQDTFYSRITAISNKIESEKKFNYLQNLYNSFKEVLKCDGCNGALEADGLSFSCNHKFCKTCSKKMSTCSVCTDLGYDANCPLPRDFSFVLQNITTMRKNYNAESIIFNLIRFLMDPKGTSVQEDPIRTPLHQVTKPNSARKKSTTEPTPRKSTRSNSSNRKLNAQPSQTPECDSDALFVDLETKTAKYKPNNPSYLEQQDSIFSPKFNKNMKTYGRNAKRKLPCTDVDASSSGGETRLKKQKEHKDNLNIVSTPKTRNLQRRNSLGQRSQNESKDSVKSSASARKSRRRLSEESFESVSDSGHEGTFIGFEQFSVIESYSKLKSARDRYKNCRAKLEPKTVIDDGSDGITRNLTNETRALRRSGRYKNEKSNEERPEKRVSVAGRAKIIERRSVVSSDRVVGEKTLKNSEESEGKSASKKHLEEKKKNKNSVPDEKLLPEMSEKDAVCSGEKPKETLKDVSGKTANEISDRKKYDEEDAVVDESTDKMDEAESNANTSDYDTEDVLDIIGPSEVWGRNNRQTRKRKTLFKSLQDRKKKNVLLKLLEEKKVLKEKSQDKTAAKSSADIIPDHSSPPVENKTNTTDRECNEDESLVEQKSPRENISNAEPIEKVSLGRGSISAETNETETSPHHPDNREQILQNDNVGSIPDEAETVPHVTVKVPLEKGSHSISEKTVKISPEVEDEILNENCAELCPAGGNSELVSEEIKMFSSDMNCVQQMFPQDSRETIESSCTPVRTRQRHETPEMETEVNFEDTSTPSLKRSKFFSPKSGGRTVSSPVELASMSTPVAKDSVSSSHGEPGESDETLKLTGFSTDSVSQDEVASCEDSRKRKCANLKRVINCQNQKSLVSLKKNFSVTSPQSLLVTRSKTVKNSPGGHEVAIEPRVDVTPCQVGSPKNVVGNRSSPASNASNSLTTREVACQTTSDLHLALLKQEFPHLFEKSSLPSSVYDSPAQSGVKSLDRTPSVVKTPVSFRRGCDARAQFTSVSSVTTSEKKRAEEEFASHSILCDSLRTPVNFLAANDSPADLSSIALLPSSEKKLLKRGTSQGDSDRRKLSVRLNFQRDSKSCSELPSTDPVVVDDDDDDDEISCSKDAISCIEDSVIYSSNVGSSAVEKQPSRARRANNKTNEGRSVPSDVDTEENLVGAEKEEGTNPAFIPDSAAPILDDVEIFKDEEKCGNPVVGDHKTPKKQNSDEEDIDFIAATPTFSDKKRLMEKDAEKYHSSRDPVTPDDVDTLDERSHPLFDTNDCRSPEPAKTAHPDGNLLSPGTAASPSKRSPVNSRPAVDETVICFATSGLKDADFRLIAAFYEKFPVIMQDKLTVESTHLIVKTDAENRASRTFKYLQAIVNSLTIVSVDWITECLRRGSIVHEEKFIPLDSSSECGPLRAYNVARGLTPSPLSWLRDYCILFKEPIPQGCTLSQLQDIVKKTGAVVVDSLDKMDEYPSHHHIIIISDDDEDTTDITKYIKYWLQKYQAVAIEFNWLLEIIGRNRLVPFYDHEFAEIPQEILMRYKFPHEMLH